jgi:uridylate kinase
MELAYSRVLLKISGESLGPGDGGGIDPGSLSRVVSEIGEARRAGVRLGIVIGAGNIWRGGRQGAGFDPGRSHQIGMVATILNGLVLGEALRAEGNEVSVYSSFAVREVVEGFDPARAREDFDGGRVVVFAGGTGNPFFTTDSAAALRAVQLGADALFKATKVDGVYDSDPETNPGAKKFPEISYEDVIRRNLGVMDAAAFAVCREHGVPILVFNMREPGALVRVARGERLGSVVRD